MPYFNKGKGFSAMFVAKTPFGKHVDPDKPELGHEKKSDLAKTFEKGKEKRQTESIQPHLDDTVDLDNPLFEGGDITKGEWNKMSQKEKDDYTAKNKEDM